jgi:hypothetical protein
MDRRFGRSRALGLAALTILLSSMHIAAAPAASARLRCGLWDPFSSMPVEWPWVGADLQDIVATSATDAWAVGTVHGYGLHPYVTHLVRGTFRRVHIDKPHMQGALNAVALVGGRPFAVGYHDGPSGHRRPLAIERVDGRWVVDRFGERLTGTTLHDITEGPNGDVWAVGQRRSAPVLFRWDGASWHDVAPPAPVGGILFGIEASPTGDLWAVGGGYVIRKLPGSPWETVSVPLPPSGVFDLLFDAAFYQDRVWLAGYYYDGDLLGTVAYEWDGTSWTSVVDPDPNYGPDREYRDLAVSRTGIVLAAGFDAQSPAWLGIVHTWRDGDPQISPIFPDGRDDLVFAGVADIPGTDTGYFMVATDNSAQGQPRVYRNCTR